MKEFEWCTGCKEYDHEKHCCPRWNKVIRDTLNDNINTVLEDIRVEIEQEYKRLSATRADETLELGECLGLKMALRIINKHRISDIEKELL